MTRLTPIAFIVGVAIYGSPCHADTLVSQSYGGTMSVIQNLSAHECAEAQCVAKYGLSCEDNDAREKAQREEGEREQQAWVTAHPKQVAECKARQGAAMKGVLSATDPAWVVENCSQQNSFTTWATYINPDDIKTAQCVK